MDEALSVLEGKAVANLMLVGHGNYEHMTLGKEGMIQSFEGKIITPKSLAKLNTILQHVVAGGNVVITACNADKEFGPVFQNYIRCDINVFMNQSTSIVPFYTSDGAVIFGNNLGTKNGTFRNITTGPRKI